jgi:serine phosphatase RsbU (regulator of sigma subunit)/anti-sigma regulatory factor (Ser/Thr protein kinase)
MDSTGVSVLDPLEVLRRVQRVSDTALAHLSVQDHLDELLLRVREILEVDTAAILLLDETKNELVARAAKGIEEEVERGVRIPVGKGFAGRIAALREPVVLDRVDHTTVMNPILYQKGIRSLFGVPLIVHGKVVGVMHVGTKTHRAFREDEVELLQVVADRAALAINARLYDRTRIVTEVFQRTFLPDVLPYLPGLVMTTRYLPAASAIGVGGDWYDAFTLPSGDMIVAIGDVAGHGLPAASTMGKMRNALRAHALLGGTPLEIVARAEEFHRHFGDGELVTLLVGVLSADLSTFRFVSAGHPPPLVVDVDGARFPTNAHGNPAIGMSQPSTFEEQTVPIERGTFVLLYTDGLVERRGESLTDGLERLRSAGEGALRATTPPVDALAALVRKVIGEHRPTDDVAVVLLGREAEVARELEFAIEARARSLVMIRRALSRWMSDLETPKDVMRDLTMAASEAAANVVEHAYGPSGGMISVEGKLEDDRVKVMIGDTGSWRGASRPDRGNGLRLMRAVMNEVVIDASPAGTIVTMAAKVTG